MSFPVLFKMTKGIHCDIPFYYDKVGLKVVYADKFFNNEIPQLITGHHSVIAMNYDYCLDVTINNKETYLLPLIEKDDNVVVYLTGRFNENTLCFYFSYDLIDYEVFHTVLDEIKYIISRKTDEFELPYKLLNEKEVLDIFPFTRNIIDYIKVKNRKVEQCLFSTNVFINLSDCDIMI